VPDGPRRGAATPERTAAPAGRAGRDARAARVVSAAAAAPAPHEESAIAVAKRAAAAAADEAPGRSDPSEVRRARLAVSSVFFLNGAVIGSWAQHVPTVKHQLGLDDGELGALLLAMAGGAVVALPIAGALVGRFGSRAMTTAAALALCVALPLPIAAGTVPAAVAAVVLLGGANGILDVSMNSQAVAVEARIGRTILSSFHGLFSLGGLTGAALAGAVLARGAAPLTHAAVTAGLAAAIVLCAARLLLDVPGAGGAGNVFALPRGPVLGFGALAFLGLLAEGAMGDWSAVYLRDALAAPTDAAALGFAAFACAMAAGRFAGDRAVRRFGARRVLRASAALAAAGLGAALAIGRPIAAIVGCGLVGAGIANVIPVLFGNAGRAQPSDPARAVAAVATAGYVGFLAGPPLIGFVAHGAGLPIALGVVCASCALIAAGARVVGASQP
jgi:fucose permease